MLFRKYLNLIYLSDLVLCNGITLPDEVPDASGQMDSNVMFPKEKPTRNDKSLWIQFMGTLTADHKTLLQPLGEYISLPHAKLRWRYDKGTENLLCSNNVNTAHEVYVPRTGKRRMRSGPVYERVRTVEGPAEGTHYATVTSHSDDRVKLHSRVCKYAEATSPDNFFNTLKSSLY